MSGPESTASPGLTRRDVEHVAKLARLALTSAELDQMTIELTAILAYAAAVASLDTDGVEPTAHPLPLVNVLRPDVVRLGVDRAEVLLMAPVTEADRFRVPRILGDAP